MKYYPIHILLKDLSFWIPFFLVEKIIKHKDYLFRTEWWTAKEIIGTSVYMSLGFMITNMAIFSLLYYLFKKWKFTPRSFMFGMLLHVLSLRLIWGSVQLADRNLNFLIAAIISLVISGYVYQRLNAINADEEPISV